MYPLVREALTLLAMLVRRRPRLCACLCAHVSVRVCARARVCVPSSLTDADIGPCSEAAMLVCSHKPPYTCAHNAGAGALA